MPIDDELEKAAFATEVHDESERTIQDILTQSGVAAAISLLPFGLGSGINDMLTKLAMRRIHERMKEMFDEMARQVHELGEEKINRDWFRGEEFQTLLFEALHQLHVTQDNQKIQMLGTALANSGATEFNEESRKELFLQLIRDLTPQHVTFLRTLSPPATKQEPGEDKKHHDWRLWLYRPQVRGVGNGLLILQTLAARGLVEETFKSVAAKEPSLGAYPSTADIDRAIKEFIKQLQQPPLRYFSLSNLGMDFLKFVGVGPEKDSAAASTP